MTNPPTAAVWDRLVDLKRRAGRPGAAGDDWHRAAGAVRAADGDASSLVPLYLDIVEAGAARPLTIAQVGQSLDGRIATETGHSQYIGGGASLDHLHRLRALVDAVVVGASTVALDDPRLTTRRVAGDSPTRVVIDPRGRLPAMARVFDGAVETLVVVDAGRSAPHPAAAGGIVQVAVAGRDGRLPPAGILAALHARGLTRVLVEGGAHTVSAFLAAGCVDRLHVAVAPMLIGSGTAAVALAPIARVDEALRLAMDPYRLGDDVLFDCRPLGRST
jgi:riboflavin-specific deaminase-like protein